MTHGDNAALVSLCVPCGFPATFPLRLSCLIRPSDLPVIACAAPIRQHAHWLTRAHHCEREFAATLALVNAYTMKPKHIPMERRMARGHLLQAADHREVAAEFR